MEKRTVKLTIHLEIETDKGNSTIQSAIRRGLHYGLDTRRVAAPKDIKLININK